jgi:hypothetical protein
MEALIIIIPVALFIGAFFLTEPGQCVIEAFRGSMGAFGIVALVGVAIAFILFGAFYIVLIIGVLIWIMAAIGGDE